MHLLRALPVLSLLFGALASPLDSRDPAPHTLGVRNADPSSLPTQVCFPVTVGGLIPGIDDQYVCACVPYTGALASTLSNGDFTILNNILNTVLEPGDPVCKYPAYGAPACTVQDPCAFKCVNGDTEASFCTISA